MRKRDINPTEWLQGFGLNHGVEVTNGQRVLYLSGQTSNGPDGAPMHAGDLIAQFRLSWQNLKDALAAADMTPENVVRLNIFTTDMGGFMAAAEDLVPIWAEDGCSPACTLVEVSSLFEAELCVELEATAVA
ncbi:MAG: RidA family protein [Gemmatimonadetes bacterium]|nr:RidA family protein [Gemmatimonadota bacterium]MBT8478428.1 RidA family protein [Gemmatimonadota bacterium]